MVHVVVVVEDGVVQDILYDEELVSIRVVDWDSIHENPDPEDTFEYPRTYEPDIEGYLTQVRKEIRELV